MEPNEDLPLQIVTQTIETHRLLPGQGRVFVAVSGGADSLCLLHMLYRLCGPGKRYPGIQLHVLHMNHELRGDASEQDALVVARIAERLELPYTQGRENVAALAKKHHYSLEEAARIARYHFLRQIAQGESIAVAHQRDDHIETLLLHWIRGGGLAGLVGLQPRQRDIIRPLLAISGKDTRAYCQQHGLEPQEDKSNSDPRFVRNRIRHELLPLLEEINPGFRNTLLRTNEIMQEDYRWLEEQVKSVWPTIVSEEQARTLYLNIPKLRALPLALQRYLLRQATARLTAGQSPLEMRHHLILEKMLNAPETGETHALDLPQRLRAFRRNDILWLTCAEDEIIFSEHPAPRTTEVRLTIPGQIHLPGTPWIAHACLLSAEVEQAVRQALEQENWSKVWQLLPINDERVYVDADTLRTSEGELQVNIRTRRDGDRMRPLGMKQEKKVQDILVNQHVPSALRAHLPLFYSDQHCIWLGGIRLDDRARLTGATHHIVCLSISRYQ